MTLNGRVVQIESGTGFADGVPRVTLLLDKEQAGLATFQDKLFIRNTDDWRLDDDITLNIHVRVGVDAEGVVT